MHLQKLSTLLKALEKPQWKRLEEYVHSPFFKVPSASVELFDYFLSIYPDFSEKKLDPSIISKKVKELPSASKQAKAGSELIKAIYHFLAYQHWQKKPQDALSHLVGALKSQKLYEWAQHENDEALETIQNIPEQTIDCFYWQHLLTETRLTGFDTILKRNEDNDIAPLVTSLDVFYALKKLRYSCELVNRKQLLGTQQQATAIQPLLQILAPYTNENHPYVWVFVQVYEMLTSASYEQGHVYYKRVQALAEKMDGKILTDSVKESMPFAINWCLQWIAKGNHEAGGDYLWWVDFKASNQLLLEQNQIAPIALRNPVMLAVQGHRSVEWAKDFIVNYSPFLPKEDKETNIAFVKALCSYYEKNYKDASRYFLLAQAKEEPIFNAIIRRWEFMSQYESDPENVSMLGNSLLAFEKYMQRNTESLHQFKTLFTLFLSYAHLLLKTKEKRARIELKNKLDKEAFFAGKDWLAKQLS